MYENMCLEIYFQCLDSNFEKREKKAVFYFWIFPIRETKSQYLKVFFCFYFN